MVYASQSLRGDEQSVNFFGDNVFTSINGICSKSSRNSHESSVNEVYESLVNFFHRKNLDRFIVHASHRSRPHQLKGT